MLVILLFSGYYWCISICHPVFVSVIFYMYNHILFNAIKRSDLASGLGINLMYTYITYYKQKSNVLRDTLNAKQSGYSFISLCTNVLLPEPDGPLNTKGWSELILRSCDTPVHTNLFTCNKLHSTTNHSDSHQQCYNTVQILL